MNPRRAEPASILIVRLSALGDVILTLPALAALRRTWPEARLGWVVEDRAAALLEGHPDLDELIVVPRRAWRDARRARGRLARLGAMRAFFRELRGKGYDTTLDFQANVKSGAVALLSGARRRLTFSRRDTREPAWLFATRSIDLEGAALHRRERDLRLIAALGREPLEAPVASLHAAADDARIDALLSDAPAGGPLVVIHPGTSSWFAPKRWPPERWAELADRLVVERGARVVLEGGPGDEAVLRDVVERMRARPLTPPHLGLRELAALLARADLVLGSDTGPLHLSAVLERPTLILFGPYDPRLLHPQGHPERAAYAAVPCSPCRYRACPRPVCMLELGVDAIFRGATALLDDAPTPAWPRAPHRTVLVR